MGIPNCSYLLVVVLLLSVIQFGSAVRSVYGKDYSLKGLQVNGKTISGPNWIFPYNLFPLCIPLNNITCYNEPNGTCMPYFVEKEQRIYNFSCSIVDLELTSGVISKIQNFSAGTHNNKVTCNLPPTPAGLFLNGYSITLYGDFGSSGITLKDRCEVIPSYQNTPLTFNSVFSQIIVLNSPPVHSGINIFVTISILLLLFMSL